MDELKYDITYDEKYMAPGYIIYRSDYKKFFKIMAGSNGGFTNFTMLVSDDVADKENMGFREIEFDIEEGSKIYNAVNYLYNDIDEQTAYSKYPTEQGRNNFRIVKNDETYKMVVTKDLGHSKNLTFNGIVLTVEGLPFCRLYNNLNKANEKCDNGYIVNKIMELKATK